MSSYELVDSGGCWAAVRDGTDVFITDDRNADLTDPGRYGILTAYTQLVKRRWGGLPRWVQTSIGLRAE